MHRTAKHVIAALALAVAVLPLAAQTNARKTPEQMKALLDAHRGDFDYLLGDWAFDATSQEYGKFSGRWSAVRLSEGQILDEYRILNDDGSTVYVTMTVRNYNAFRDRWELIGFDEGNGLLSFGTAQRVGREMHLEQRFGVDSPQPSIWRIKYMDIQPDRFSWVADRSIDEGKTWTTGFQRIEARRIGPARTLDPLTGAKKSAGLPR